MVGMRRAALAIALLLVTPGCGGVVVQQRHSPAGERLSAFGVTISLPAGWDGRVLLGAEGRPVVHAASFPLPANDTDEGEVAKEAMGSTGMYLNVRDLGPGDSPVGFPFSFSPADFGPPPPGPGSLCCRIQEASREVAFDGELYRITAVSGGDGAPPDARLEELNGAIFSLSVEHYQPQPVEPATGEPISGFGLHADLPDGWKGNVQRGVVQASDGSITLRIVEHGGTDAASFITGRIPIRLGLAEFVQANGVSGYETGRSFVDSGRDFVLSARSSENPPDSISLGRANAFLASFRAEPGDFYPGTVEAATFASAPGWDTGTTGPAKEQPDGQQTMTWASTVPYRDSGFQLPPRDTIEQLPPDGIVIDAQLFGPVERYERNAEPPFRIEQAEREFPWEGQVGEVPLYSIGGRVHGQSYEVSIWVFFGRNHPTAEQVAAADAELARLNLPDWN
jgi:hypothetical protein